MPKSLTLICSRCCVSIVIVSPPEIETTLPERAKRGQAITKIAATNFNTKIKPRLIVFLGYRISDLYPQTVQDHILLLKGRL